MTPADIRTWRECMGYTQQQAAQALGVSLRTVKSWEAGFAAPPAFQAAQTGFDSRRPLHKPGKALRFCRVLFCMRGAVHEWMCVRRRHSPA